MSRIKDEVGNRYGRLLVLERAESTSRGQAQWLCQCDCGNTTIVIGSHLRNGHTVSCGCRMQETGKENYKDLTGKRFGSLLVLERVENIDGLVAFRCQCDCGKQIVTKAKYLSWNQITSCGCKRQSNGENIIENLLIDNHIVYEKEKTFPDLLSIKDNKTPYRYDFYLPDYNRLIEFDGLQHVSTIADNYFDRSYQEVHQIDEIKNKYAKNKGIHLVRIPYNKIHNLVINDLLDKKFEI